MRDLHPSPIKIVGAEAWKKHGGRPGEGGGGPSRHGGKFLEIFLVNILRFGRLQTYANGICSL